MTMPPVFGASAKIARAVLAWTTGVLIGYFVISMILGPALGTWPYQAVRGYFYPDSRIMSDLECVEEVRNRSSGNASLETSEILDKYFETTNSNYDYPEGHCFSLSADEGIFSRSADPPKKFGKCSGLGLTRGPGDRFMGTTYVCLNEQWHYLAGSPCPIQNATLRDGDRLWRCDDANPGTWDANPGTWREQNQPPKKLIPSNEPDSSCGTDSDCGLYDEWEDYPEEDNPPDSGWEPYDNGREWVNDPDDTWGDGR